MAIEFLNGQNLTQVNGHKAKELPATGKWCAARLHGMKECAKKWHCVTGNNKRAFKFLSVFLIN